MKTIQAILAAFFITACNKVDNISSPTADTVNTNFVFRDRQISGDSLLRLLYTVDKSDSLIKTNNFGTLTEFPKTWLALNPTEFGPVVYKRGTAVGQLLIKPDSIIASGQDETIKSRIKNFRKIGKEKYLLTSEEGSPSYTFEILDQKLMLTVVRWTVESDNTILGEGEWLYVPKQKEYLVKHVDEPIENNAPGSWIKFTILNIDSVKENWR